MSLRPNRMTCQENIELLKIIVLTTGSLPDQIPAITFNLGVDIFESVAT